MDIGYASLARRLAFAGDAWFFFDRIFTGRGLARLARIGHSQSARLLDHGARIGFDLLECLRTGSWVPDIGTVELALDSASQPIPQHPRYLGYWHDPALQSMVGMLIGIDLIRHNGRYYVLEFNHGPSIYARRRAMYDSPFDPLVSGMLEHARELGFERFVPIALRWSPEYVEEWERAGREYGIAVEPTNCPLLQSSTPRRMIALPDPLPPKTMYVIHSGLWTPLCRYIDNKWYSSRWMANALPAGANVTIPATRDSFFFPEEDFGERWPNLIVKLAGGARSAAVIAGRFTNEAEAREALGVNGNGSIPRQLRGEYTNSLLFFGRERVIYQAFIPPELDGRGHARLFRLHLLVSPLCTTYLSAHRRVSRNPVPEVAPHGVIGRDEVFIFNNADYELLEPELEDELRDVAAQLGGAMQRAIARKFVVAPARPAA
jgi:hypothetical protein